MNGDSDYILTEADRHEAARQVRAGTRGTVVALAGILLVSGLAAGAIAGAILDDAGVIEMALMVGAATLVVSAPMLYAVVRITKVRGMAMAIDAVAQERLMHADAERREFESKLARALEMAENEDAAFDTIERGLKLALPGSPVELLLADNSHAHLDRVVAVAAADASCGSQGGCPVASPDQCLAARRAQTQVFPDSDALDGCPMLRVRGGDDFSAVCVPVSIMGRTVGVLHATGPHHQSPDKGTITALQVL